MESDREVKTMANAYNYKDIVDEKTNPPIKNAEYCTINRLEDTPLRRSDIIIRPVSAKFEPYVPEIQSYNVTITYPKGVTLYYNDKKVNVSSTAGGSSMSIITVPSIENGSPYFVTLKYSPVCRLFYDGKVTTNGVISLGQITYDKTINLEYKYKYVFSNPDKNATIITLDDGSAANADETMGGNYFSRSESTINATIGLKSGYQIARFECENCSISATETENRYEINYGDLSITEAKITIITQEKQVEKTYYNVTIKGLGHSSAVYNNSTLSKNNGNSFIPNIESGTSISLTINCDAGFYLNSISYNGNTTSYSDEPSIATVTIPINGNTDVVVVTKLQYFRILFSASPYINYVKLANQQTEGQEACLLKYSISKMLNTAYELEFNFDTTQYALTSVTCSTGATITSPSETNSNYLFTLTSDNTARIDLNYTLTPIGKKSIAFSGVKNVLLKKGSQELNTSTDAYSETVNSGSSLVYTLSPKEGFNLTNVSITPTSTKYSYSDGILRINNITDNVSVACTTVQKTELSLITVNLAVEGGTLGHILLDNQTTLTQEEPLEIRTGSKSKFYISPKTLELGLIQTGKKVSSITSSAGGSITGSATNGYYFQLTDVYNYPSITITVTLIDETSAPIQKHTVSFHNSENAIITYNNSIRSPTYVNGSDWITDISVENGNDLTVKVEVSDTNKYEISSFPSISTAGYTSNWNANEQTLTIQNITSNIDVYLKIRAKQEQTSTADGSVNFHADYSKYSSSAYWFVNSDGHYEYSSSLNSLLLTTAWWTCFDYKFSSEYTIETEYDNIDKIYVYRSINAIEAKNIGSSPAGKITLSADSLKVDNGYKIPAKTIGTSADCKAFKYVYFAFVRKNRSTEVPVIKDIKYTLDDIGTSGFATDEIFDSEKISDFQFIKECDPTSQNIVYSSLSFKVYDENNTFKLSKYNINSETSINTLSEGFPYEVYSLSANAVNKKTLSNNDFFIVQIGKMFLNRISYDGNYSIFEFIGLIEKYDKIFLNSSEKRYSDYYYPVNTRSYLKILFGSDIDVSEIPESFSSITPFEDESKSEILRIIAEFLGAIVFEGSDGKIHFSMRNTPNNPITFEGMTTPYKLTLDNCINFPSYEQLYSTYDSANVQITKRIKNTSSKIFENVTFNMYVKLSEADSGEDWENDNDWKLVIKSNDSANYYYDIDNVEYIAWSNSDNGSEDDIDIIHLLNSFGEIKYIKFDIEFPDPATNVRYYCADLVKDVIGVESYTFDDFCDYLYGNTIRKSLFIKHWQRPNDGDSIQDIVKAYLSQKRFELYAKFPIERNANDPSKYTIHYAMADIFSYANFIFGIANSDFDVYITNPPSQIDYGTILLDIFLSVWFSLSNSTAERITTATRNYFTKLASTAQNTFEYSNPLVRDRPSAGLSATQSLLASNNSTIEVTIDDWRGNGLVELGDNILFEHSTGRDSKRKYSDYYCGIVKKNEYTFDGALSMNTTLTLGNSEFYDSENANTEFMVKLSDSPKFINGEVKFTKKK